jgi:uncharacterized membrane protein YfcA
MIEFIIAGLFTGFFSGFFGIGGGTILVPTLLYFGLSMKTAIGISVTQMMISSIFGSFLNYKKGLLKFNEGVFLGVGGAVGAMMSGFLVRNLSNKFLGFMFLFILAFAIMKFFYAPHENNENNEINNKFLLFLVGIFVGSIAISVGVGGAVMITPILVGILRYDLKKAVSLSLFFVSFSATSGFISLSSYGLINYKLGFLVAIFSLAGVFFGIKIYHLIDAKNHKKQLLWWYILIFVLTAYKIIMP